MRVPDAAENLSPEVRLRVNGADLPSEAEADVVEVSVLQDVSAPGMFTLLLLNWNEDEGRVTWADERLFAEGSEVEILMGYEGRLASVMVGEITGLEPEFQAEEVPMLTVRGYDRRHRLMRGRKTRTFTQVKDSDIAAKVAREAGLTPETRDTTVTWEYVLQHNQTDFEFLQSRAALHGYEVVVEGRKLKFRPHLNDQSEVLTLTREEDLLEFHPRLSAVGLAGAVEVRGWSPKEKKALLGTAAAGDVGKTMGGSTGLAAADRAFATAVATAVDWPVRSQGEADQIAKGRLKEMALSYVTGEGVAIGCTDLKAGSVIKINGCGRRFSGRYYLASVCHTYSPSRGYRSAFTVRRNAT